MVPQCGFLYGSVCGLNPDVMGGGLSQGLPEVGEALQKFGVPALLAKGAFGIAN